MANKRREENRHRSERMANREDGHRERGFNGEKGRESRSSGSYAHRGERVGPGEVPGAGELDARPTADMEGGRGLPPDRNPGERSSGSRGGRGPGRSVDSDEG